MSEKIHPAAAALLRGLVTLGKRAAAAAIDAGLEEAEVVVDDVRQRIKAGRAQAADIKQRPKRHIDVDARVVDEEDE